MQMGYIVAGFIFLLNPNINIVDFLPDFIGYILIIKGLSKLSDIEDRLFDARKKAIWLLYVSIVKFGFILLVPTSSDSDILLFTFGFAVVELLLVIPMLNNFFSGTNYLASRYDSDSSLEKESEAKFFIITFMILKNVIVLVPELFSLDNSVLEYNLNYDYYNHIHNIELIKKIVIIGCFLLVLICAVIMGIKFIKYLLSLKRDKNFIAKLDEYYKNNILSDTSLWNKRYKNAAINLFAVGILFFNNIYIDSLPIVPDFVGYVFILCATFYLSKLKFANFKLSLLSMLGILFSLLSFFNRIYCSNFGANSFYYYNFYKQPFTIPLDIICAIIFIFVSFILLDNVATITKNNPDDLKFPASLLKIFMPIVAVSTIVEDVLPEYRALTTIILIIAVAMITIISATQMLKMKTN